MVYKNIYKLRLPLKSRSYPVFYIGMLELVPPDILLVIKEVDQEGDGEYEVEKF